MNVRTLTFRTSLPVLRAEIIYSLARLKAHPLAAPHVPTFDVLRSECDAVFTTENTLRDSLAEAEAAIDMRDEALDDGADRPRRRRRRRRCWPSFRPRRRRKPRPRPRRRRPGPSSSSWR